MVKIVSQQWEIALFQCVLSLGDALFYWRRNNIPDYKSMYYKLFNSVTDAIEILKKAQLETEEIYIDSSEKDDHKVVEFKIVENKD